MRYFVTGATGFIGGRVVRLLTAAGHRVTALVRNPAKAEALKGAGAELCAGDITDKESMRAGMSGADGVFHIAASYRFGREAHNIEFINVDGTQNVLRLMKELSVPKGVYTSTVAVFSDTKGKLVDETYRHRGALHGWLSEYERTKWLAHYEVAVPMIEAGLPLVIVQPSLVYGPGDTSPVSRILGDFLRRRLPAVPRGSMHCWGFVDDIAAGHLLAMEKGRIGESYVLAGPPHTVVEAFAVAEKLTGIPAPRRQIPPSLVRGLAAVAQFVEKRYALPEAYASDTLRSMAGVTFIASSAKAERELGFHARPLEEGLPDTLAWEQARLKVAH